MPSPSKQHHLHSIFWVEVTGVEPANFICCIYSKFGLRGRDRTDDLLIPNQTRYQTALHGG